MAEKDVDILVQQTFFSQKVPGVIIDVGAARPDYLSISESFRRLGWKVVAIEPNPEFCSAYRASGYEVLQYAASDSDADDAEFFVVDSHGTSYLDGEVSYESFSSLGIGGKYAALREEHAPGVSVKTIRVVVRRLDRILAEHEPGLTKVDVLSVDVEGWELAVMRGFDLGRYRPKVVILENLFASEDYVRYMRDRGYSLWARLEPNDLYVREET
jgi:FkbM family methyltransferase